jgi:hypothetical protein
MPTFVLKKYEPTPPAAPADVATDKEPTTEKGEEPVTFAVTTNDSVSQIVAMALYKSMPNNVQITEGEDEDGDAAKLNALSVIDSKSVNDQPVLTLEQVSGYGTVAVLSRGFNTKQEEWFLNSLGNRNSRVLYSMQGVVAHVKKQLGVTDES